MHDRAVIHAAKSAECIHSRLFDVRDADQGRHASIQTASLMKRGIKLIVRCVRIVSDRYTVPTSLYRALVSTIVCFAAMFLCSAAVFDGDQAANGDTTWRDRDYFCCSRDYF